MLFDVQPTKSTFKSDEDGDFAQIVNYLVEQVAGCLDEVPLPRHRENHACVDRAEESKRSIRVHALYRTSIICPAHTNQDGMGGKRKCIEFAAADSDRSRVLDRGGLRIYLFDEAPFGVCLGDHHLRRGWFEVVGLEETEGKRVLIRTRRAASECA